MTRRELGLLALLLLVQAILVYGVFVPAPHPGGDNAAYVTLAHSIHTGQGYTELWDPAAPPHTKYPPLFPFLLALALAFGATGWVGLKLVPALLALAAVAGTFLWARRRLGLPEGFAVAVLAGLSPALLYHSHWVLSDVPFVAFTVLALGSLERVQEDDASADDVGPIWGIVSWPLVTAVAWIFLAYFTRSAGLPLLVAAVAALALRRRWSATVAVAAGVGVPALAWLLRARAVGPGEARYASEFLLVDPYQPDLGVVGVGGFLERIVDNAAGYGTRYLQEALFGGAASPAVVLGLAVVGLAMIGWVRAFRRGPGVTEVFVPLYLGLILVWPTVWSGDRFALPLLPPLLILSVEGVRVLSDRLREGARIWVLLGAAVTVGAPGLQDWFGARQEGSACRAAVEVAGPWACGGRAMVDFVAAAEWAADSLPEGTPVLTRKPRIWYVMSGVPSRTYPFSQEPGALADAAARAETDLVLLDYVGGQGTRYVGAALAREPGRFCQLGVFGGDGDLPAARLLRLVPSDAPYGSRSEEGQILLANCPPPPEAVVLVRTQGAGRGGIVLLRGRATRGDGGEGL